MRLAPRPWKKYYLGLCKCAWLLRGYENILDLHFFEGKIVPQARRREHTHAPQARRREHTHASTFPSKEVSRSPTAPFFPEKSCSLSPADKSTLSALAGA